MRLRCQTVLSLPNLPLDPGRRQTRPGPSLCALTLPFLASCALFSPSTTVSIQVAKPNGETISAEYHSTKDIAAPSFLLERNPETGQIESIELAAETSAASPVVDANANMLGAAIGAGVAAGLRAGGP